MTTLRITDRRGRVWEFHDVAHSKKGGVATPSRVLKASCHDAAKSKAVLQPPTNATGIRKSAG